MPHAIGSILPAGTMQHYVAVSGEGCPVGPVEFDVPSRLHGKRVVLFGVPGAFTPTCSERHVPGFVARYDAFLALQVDEIWCISVNDAHVMHAWGNALQVGNTIQMTADGNGDYTRSLGLDVDLRARHMGVRSRRYAMVVENGILRALFLEEPGQFDVSRAESVLQYLHDHPFGNTRENQS